MILVHTCCAICLSYVRKKLEEEGYEIISFWYNPNIHPYREFLKRRDALKKYAELTNLDVIYDDEYPLTNILENMAKLTKKNPVYRCRYCYELRLDKTAKLAKRMNIDTFTTTLLISPYQKHEEIKKIGENIANKYGIKFLYRDFREGFKEAHRLVKGMGLYHQNYCGCVFSEYEKYFFKNKI